MCGIAGFLDPAGRYTAEASLAVGRRMAAALTHRGPDDCGEWQDEESGLILLHRRLSIIDLSPQGHQPMISASGRFVVTYNGEIYNFRKLADEARREGVVFRGSSDTEALLAVIERYGVESALRRLVGMFAFAVWDRQQRVLHLARDRIGEKPLYYGWVGNVFSFASELKALRCHPEWQGEVNRHALGSLLKHGYVAGTSSIFKGVYKLAPGTVLSITEQHLKRRSELSPDPDAGGPVVHPVRYWSLSAVVGRDSRRPEIDEKTAVDELEARLGAAVGGQMISDVPLGALLSGGIDSSLIVALMQSQSSKPVKTFTIGFGESSYNEAGHARRVAEHLGTDHTEAFVTPDEAREVIPRLPHLYDEPFADSSQIPTHIVAAIAHSQVKVALSGDGGDELFGGYARYDITNRLWSRIQSIPAPVRRAVAECLRHCPRRLMPALMSLVARFASTPIQISTKSDQFLRLLELLKIRRFGSFYDSMVSHWKAPDSVVAGWEGESLPGVCDRMPPELESTYEQMMYADTLGYLPDDILTKVDRASMGVSLEMRVPFLDHRLVEWAWMVPQNLKVQDRQGKYIVKKLLERYVPREVTERPKMGFGVPIDEWLRGPLRDWAEELLSEDRLRREGYFNPAPIRSLWQEHLSGRANWHYYLWDVLMFQAWHEANA